MSNHTCLRQLCQAYDRLQTTYGDSSLKSIYFGGQTNEPQVAFVFMNPTKRNIATHLDWQGIRAPWVGTKNIWDLFQAVGLLDDDIYGQIRERTGPSWTPEFANKVYDNVIKYNYFITNLAKCTQVDARPLKDDVFRQYLSLFAHEIDIIKPKKIVLFGNQVSSIVLGQRISVSQCRRQLFDWQTPNNTFQCLPVYYPVGNGHFNIDKSIDDIKWLLSIIDK